MKKPFNLESAQKGAKLITRNGRTAKLVGYFPDLLFPVLAHIAGDRTVTAFSAGGMHNSADMCHTDEDLFIHIESRRYFVNMYRSGRFFTFDDADAARKAATPDAVAVAFPMDFEEGIL